MSNVEGYFSFDKYAFTVPNFLTYLLSKIGTNRLNIELEDMGYEGLPDVDTVEVMADDYDSGILKDSENARKALAQFLISYDIDHFVDERVFSSRTTSLGHMRPIGPKHQFRYDENMGKELVIDVPDYVKISDIEQILNMSNLTNEGRIKLLMEEASKELMELKEHNRLTSKIFDKDCCKVHVANLFMSASMNNIWLIDEVESGNITMPEFIMDAIDKLTESEKEDVAKAVLPNGLALSNIVAYMATGMVVQDRDIQDRIDDTIKCLNTLNEIGVPMDLHSNGGTFDVLTSLIKISSVNLPDEKIIELIDKYNLNIHSLELATSYYATAIQNERYDLLHYLAENDVYINGNGGILNGDDEPKMLSAIMRSKESRRFFVQAIKNGLCLNDELGIGNSNIFTSYIGKMGSLTCSELREEAYSFSVMLEAVSRLNEKDRANSIYSIANYSLPTFIISAINHIRHEFESEYVEEAIGDFEDKISTFLEFSEQIFSKKNSPHVHNISASPAFSGTFKTLSRIWYQINRLDIDEEAKEHMANIVANASVEFLKQAPSVSSVTTLPVGSDKRNILQDHIANNENESKIWRAIAINMATEFPEMTEHEKGPYGRFAGGNALDLLDYYGHQDIVIEIRHKTLENKLDGYAVQDNGVLSSSPVSTARI